MNYGRYQIIKEVGHGSMGVVYQALDPHINRLLAVKVLRKDREISDDAIQRFKKEAIVIGRLSHPHIETIYDVGEEDGTVYFAMEFLEGKTLSDVIKEKPLSTEEVVVFGIQIAEALDYAHQKGVIHRDIKPGNIVVQPDGQLKITDFGVAHIDNTSATLQTQAGEIMGTPAYMSPEQVLGKPVDGRSDLFSLGVILYELSTGKRPFGGDGKALATVFNEVIQITPPEPRSISTPVPSVLSGLIMKSLQKEPGKRFQTGKELAAALKDCLGGKEPEAATAASIRVKKRNFGAIFAVAAVLASITYGIYYYLLNRDVSPLKPPRIQKNIPPESNRDTPASAPGALQYPPAPESQQVMLPALQPEAKSAESEKTSPEPSRDIPEPLPEAKQSIPEPVIQSPPHLPPPPAAPPAAKSTEAKKPEPKPLFREQKPLPAPSRTDQLHLKPSQEKEQKKQPSQSVKSVPDAMFTPLKVRTTPQGASVYIDGILKGTSPLTVILSVGKHQVRISFSGYQDLEKQITVEEMMEYPLTFSLKAIEEPTGIKR
jgi:eukaryotic-like serine/threonine-protein kinase